MELSKLIVPVTTTMVEYPGYEGFEIEVAYITRDELIKLRKKATTTKISRKTRTPEEEVDSDLLQDLYIKTIIVGWKGLKYKYLAKMIPIDLNQLEDMEEVLDYTHENAIALMKNAPDFDIFISDAVGDLENFTPTK